MTFNILKQVGEAKKARTLNNKTVTREDKLFVEDWGVFVACAPYDEHFLYEDDVPGQSAYMCTCGAPAVVAPPGPHGLFVCLFHATYGFHQTSVINKDEFGQTDEVKEVKGRKWLI